MACQAAGFCPTGAGAAAVAQPETVRASATAIIAPAILLRYVLINMSCSFVSGDVGAGHVERAGGEQQQAVSEQGAGTGPGREHQRHVAGVLQGGGRSQKRPDAQALRNL